MAAGEQYEAGSRAYAAEPPAHAEHRRARQQWFVDSAAIRQIHRRAEQTAPVAPHEPEGRRGGEHGGAHHECQLRPPLAEDVEKAEYVGRVRHSGDEQTRPEQQTREQRGEKFHGTPPWRTTNTVSTADVMKTSVATSERVDRFASPQTP